MPELPVRSIPAESAIYLGIEIGGSKLQAGLGDGTGTLYRLARVRAGADGEAIRQQLGPLVATLLNDAGVLRQRISRAGIGFGGPVDRAGGRTIRSHQVAGWDDVPLAAWFEREIGLPAVLGNDSDLAGLAEAHVGAGRGFDPVVYMNIGSGIGGALVVGGQLYSAQGSGAMEIGHLRIAPAAPGQPWQTLEDLCSGWNLAEAARAAMRREPDGLVAALAAGDESKVSTELLAEAVRRGDPAALAIWGLAVERLGVAIANVITLLQPACFVLGGGVAQVGPLLLDPVRDEVARQVFPPFAGTYRIEPAQLGAEVVVYGALEWARTSDRSKINQGSAGVTMASGRCDHGERPV